MGGIVVASDKVSELAGRFADFVADKLAERNEEDYDLSDFGEDIDLDDIDLGEFIDNAKDAAEDAAEDVADKVEDVVEDIKDDIEKNIEE